MLSVGIVGLPNVGKSTLFNAITGSAVPAENYPFCTIDPSVGIVGVPDDRLFKLSLFSKSAKTIPAAIEFVDIAGLVVGASKGEGLGNKFLSNIREVDAIAHMVRVFEDGSVGHVSGSLDPIRDIEEINLELMLADLEVVNKRIDGLSRDVKRNIKEAITETDVLLRAKKYLEDELFVIELPRTEEEAKILKRNNLLTNKETVYVLNKKYGEENRHETSVLEFLKKKNAKSVFLDASFENDLAALGEDERGVYKKEFNVAADGIGELSAACLNVLGLITFFTTGEDESRAWTIKNGSSAPVAGSAIHSDFRDKFIKADVINWRTLIESGSYATARSRGLIRIEGKEYVVDDGDVIEFKI